MKAFLIALSLLMISCEEESQKKAPKLPSNFVAKGSSIVEADGYLYTITTFYDTERKTTCYIHGNGIFCLKDEVAPSK